MIRCTKCVLPESYPGITFGQNGVCNYCHSYKKKEYIGEARLTEILESYRNKGKHYDVVVGISGGRDSSYALYYLVKKAKLRVLAYTIDNGVVTEQAKVNMKSMTEILDVKLIVDDNDLTKRCLKHNLKSWIFRPAPGMILLTCTICNAGIKTGLLKTAKKYGVPLIVTGGGGIELAGFKGILVGENSDKKKPTTVSVAFKMMLELIKNPLYLLNPTCLIAETNAFINLYMPFLHKIIYPRQNIIKLFDYIEDDENLIYSTITNELNWKKSADVASGWRFDCQLSHLKNHLYYEIYGFSEKEDMYSNMIRQGVLDRDNALQRVEKENYIPPRIISDFCDEIGVDSADLKKAVNKLKK
jgi:hypothetical protein